MLAKTYPRLLVPTVCKNCPLPEEIMNVAGNTETETYPRLLGPTGVDILVSIEFPSTHKITMKVLKFILAVIMVLAVVHVERNLGGRVLNMEEQLNLMSLDNKGPVTPSGPSTCTYIPRTGGKNCPPLEEMDVAGNFQHRAH
ncbi:hypothetical protein V8G54_028962 [Vigna mungo]|uniref:Uncharacterized protein n=1 Tax=Vigna mungo TaxID=3915 RepID=A0AAQ3MTF0_VIGMU